MLFSENGKEIPELRLLRLIFNGEHRYYYWPSGRNTKGELVWIVTTAENQ